MTLILGYVYLLTITTPLVWSYGMGAPPNKCGPSADMVPEHYSTPQTSAVPYTLTTSTGQVTYQPQQVFTLTIEGGTFKGYLIQAKDESGSLSGFFTVTDACSQALSCGGVGNSGLTHISNAEKTSCAFQWEAPPNTVGDITFYVTFVQNYGTFWVQETPLVLSESTSSGGETTSSDTSPPVTNTPLPQTTFVSPTTDSDTLTSSTLPSPQVTTHPGLLSHNTTTSVAGTNVAIPAVIGATRDLENVSTAVGGNTDGFDSFSNTIPGISKDNSLSSYYANGFVNKDPDIARTDVTSKDRFNGFNNEIPGSLSNDLSALNPRDNGFVNEITGVIHKANTELGGNIHDFENNYHSNVGTHTDGFMNGFQNIVKSAPTDADSRTNGFVNKVNIASTDSVDGFVNEKPSSIPNAQAGAKIDGFENGLLGKVNGQTALGTNVEGFVNEIPNKLYNGQAGLGTNADGFANVVPKRNSNGQGALTDGFDSKMFDNVSNNSNHVALGDTIDGFTNETKNKFLVTNRTLNSKLDVKNVSLIEPVINQTSYVSTDGFLGDPVIGSTSTPSDILNQTTNHLSDAQPLNDAFLNEMLDISSHNHITASHTDGIIHEPINTVPNSQNVIHNITTVNENLHTASTEQIPPASVDGILNEMHDNVLSKPSNAVANDGFLSEPSDTAVDGFSEHNVDISNVIHNNVSNKSVGSNSGILNLNKMPGVINNHASPRTIPNITNSSIDNMSNRLQPSHPFDGFVTDAHDRPITDTTGLGTHDGFTTDHFQNMFQGQSMQNNQGSSTHSFMGSDITSRYMGRQLKPTSLRPDPTPRDAAGHGVTVANSASHFVSNNPHNHNGATNNALFSTRTNTGVIDTNTIDSPNYGGFVNDIQPTSHTTSEIGIDATRKSSSRLPGNSDGFIVSELPSHDPGLIGRKAADLLNNNSDSSTQGHTVNKVQNKPIGPLRGFLQSNAFKNINTSNINVINRQKGHLATTTNSDIRNSKATSVPLNQILSNLSETLSTLRILQKSLSNNTSDTSSRQQLQILLSEQATPLNLLTSPGSGNSLQGTTSNPSNITDSVGLISKWRQEIMEMINAMSNQSSVTSPRDVDVSRTSPRGIESLASLATSPHGVHFLGTSPRGLGTFGTSPRGLKSSALSSRGIGTSTRGVEMSTRSLVTVHSRHDHHETHGQSEAPSHPGVQTNILPQAVKTAHVKGGRIIYDPECGSSKGCFLDCSGQDCKYMVTWRDRGTHVQFEMYGKPEQAFSDAWMAVGFSGDSRMGGDSVTECVFNNGQLQAFNSYNQGYSNKRLNPSQLGLMGVQGYYSNGVMYCTFERQKSMNVQQEMFDLEQDWHLMFANGQAMQVPAWHLSMHSTSDLPPATASVVDYQSFAVIGSAAKFPLVKAHGCLMIFAWVMFTGIGIVVARYYKSVWSDKTLLKLKIWFQIHRGCMVSALALDVIAFIIIFVEVGGYSEIPDNNTGKGYLRSHPVLGIIVTALCLANPIMALFRPGPDHDKRPLFNWAHWGVGMTAYILSAICICFGFQLGKSSTPDYAVYIMIVYVLYVIVFDVVFEVMECLRKKEKTTKVEGIEMSSRNGNTDNGTVVPNGNGTYHSKDKVKNTDKIKTMLLAIHIAFTGAFALVLALVVALN